MNFRLTRRGASALGGLLSAMAAVVALVYALSYPYELAPWLVLSGLIIATGFAAHHARRRRD